MPIIAIIPVKSFAMGKQRLAGALRGETRARLGRALADHVVTTVAEAGLLPLVVTADPEVAQWSTLSGIPSLPDPDEGLDAAAARGVQWAEEAASSWLVLHGDLPLLRAPDVLALEEVLRDGRDVLAPSADGGTSAVGSSHAIEFGFGPSSFHRHLNALGDPVVVARPGLLLDVDSPADLQSAISTRQGAWMRDVIAGSGASL